MSKIVGDTACPRCVKAGRDKTRNHLMLFEDGGAHCNRCGYTDSWRDNDSISYREKKVLTKEELDALLEEFHSCKTGAYPERGLTKETVERYGCKIGHHPTSKDKIGSYLLPFHTLNKDKSYEVTGYKVGIPKEYRRKDLPKYYNRGSVKEASMFGEHLLPNKPYKKLFITESPMDTMALYQAIKESNKGTKWSNIEPNVIGLPHGTGSIIKSLDMMGKKLDLAEEVILVFDNDEAGQEAVDKARQFRPGVKTVDLPMKDCNDMLVSGKGSDLAKLAMWGATAVKPDNILDIGDLLSEITKVPTWGSSYPWPTLTKLTYGIRSEIIGFAGGVGVGKSDFKYEMIANDLANTEDNIAVFDLEATPGRTGKAVVGKLTRQLLHKPDCEYDIDEVSAEIAKHKGRLKVYNHRGGKEWEDIAAAIRHMVVVDGCKRIYLDNMTPLTSGLSSSEANDKLNNIMSEVSSMINDLDFAFIYFAHLNPPKNGPSHERGGKVLESQITGSRAMIKWSSYIIGLERNKDPELPEFERNVTTVSLLKDREFGNVGRFKVYYEPETGILKEMFT